MLIPNFGVKFKQALKDWLNNYPEIFAEWSENQLMLQHSYDFKEIQIHFEQDTITITNNGESKTFQSAHFQNFTVQFNKITNCILECFCVEFEKKRIPLKNGEVALMMCQSETGIIVNTHYNIHNGLGHVYQKFDSLKSVLEHIKASQKYDYEYIIYNTDYELLRF